MDLFVAIFIVSGFAVLWLWSLLNRRRERQQIESICALQEQRLVGQISERHLDPDFRLVCRAVAAVASEALGQSNMKIDPDRLALSDTMYGNLGMSLDSLSHVNLICELEKEIGRKLDIRDFHGVSTVEELYFVLFPERVE